MSSACIHQYLRQQARVVEKALAGLLEEKKSVYPTALTKAMRYSVLSSGKRVRPFLALESGKLFGASEKKILPLACAIEMIHCYSLVHDDLPAMDDDDFRRGKRTCHRQFNEGVAILVGDALLTKAFEVIARAKSVGHDIKVRVIEAVARAAGPEGMVGGQAADLQYQQSTSKKELLDHVHRLKTGALIAVSLTAGALWAGAGRKDLKRVQAYGEDIGFLFQVVDDIIDRDGYASLMGMEKSYRLATRLRDRAKHHLRSFGNRAKTLLGFADFLYERKK